MLKVNPVTSMDVRAVEHNKISVVITHKNGEKIGNIMSAARAVEIIDELVIL